MWTQGEGGDDWEVGICELLYVKEIVVVQFLSHV